MKPISVTPEYLAALIDGEGHIRMRSTPCVEITNAHKPTLDLIEKKFGGRVYCTNPTREYKHRAIWRWVGNAADAIRVLLYTKDHMKMKGLIAEACLRANLLKSDPIMKAILVGFMKHEQEKEFLS